MTVQLNKNQNDVSESGIRYYLVNSGYRAEKTVFSYGGIQEVRGKI